MVDFDYHVNLGQIITAIGSIGTALAIVINLRSKVDRLEESRKENDYRIHEDNRRSEKSREDTDRRIDQRFTSVETELRKQTDILIELAKNSERISHLERGQLDLSLMIKAAILDIREVQRYSIEKGVAVK